jgi:hypothetical protein
MWEISVKLNENSNYIICIFPETISPQTVIKYLIRDDPLWIKGGFYGGKYNKPHIRKYPYYAQTWTPLPGIGNKDCFLAVLKELPRSR